MPKYSTAFGMDVHLRSTTVCALDADTGEAVTRRFPGNPWGEIAGWMDGFPGPSLAAYESGYLGFAPQRELAGLGVECVVAAVSKIPRSAADSASKNDRNDAARMAKAILAHDISPVWIPSPEVEGIRDLAGAYDGATARLATAKQRLLAFLAKRGFVYGGTTPAGNPRKYWTYDFLRWLDKVRPEDDGGVRTLAALRNEVEAAAEARADLLSEYRAAVDASPIAAEVAALQSIKGCAFALAAAFSAEVGDFTRFRSGRQVTAYFGLAPSQRSSGDSVRLGGISGAGNALVRKLAVEGSWCYAAARHQPKLMPRDTGVPLEIRMHGRKGSERLLRRREEHVDETASKHAICTSGSQKRIYLHRNQNETSARRLMRNFAATVRYYPYSIKFAAHGVPRPTFFFSINWRKHELHAESSRRAQGPLSRAA